MIICGTHIYIYTYISGKNTTKYYTVPVIFRLFRQTWSISWLLVPRVITAPSHHQRFHMRCERQIQNKMPIITVCYKLTLELTRCMRLLPKYISSTCSYSDTFFIGFNGKCTSNHLTILPTLYNYRDGEQSILIDRLDLLTITGDGLFRWHRDCYL